MKIFEGRLNQFKKEIHSIFFLSLIQIIWCFNCPPIQRLGGFLSTSISIILSISGILIYIFAFVFPEKLIPQLNLEWLNDAPHADTLKDIFKIMMLLVFHSLIFYLWYEDFYGMSHVHYAFSYGHCVLAFVLMTRALERYNNSRE